MGTNEKTTDMNAKLGFLERFAYGLGDYSGNLIYSAISSFLLVYYVSVLKVDPTAAASIMAVSKLFDGVSDLIMGRIVDKTKSKWGKARPWLLRMGIPLAVCSVLMYSVPASLAGKAQIAYMFLTYNMVSTIFYTAYNVPYATMMGLMTTNQNERALLGNFRVLLATAGTMTVNTFVMKLCTFFGGAYYYAQYIMGKESSFGTISNALSMAQLLIMFATPVIMVKIGKRRLILAGMIISGIGFILTAPAGSNITMVVGCNILKGAGFGCAGAKAAINTSCIWIPLIACVICAVCMLLFDLDKHYGHAVEELEQGRFKNTEK